MHQHGDFLSKTLLQHAHAGVFLVFLNKGVYGLFIQRGEDLDVFLGVLVADIEPELVELVRRGALRVEPDVAALCLAELLAICLSNEGASQGKGFVFKA